MRSDHRRHDRLLVTRFAVGDAYSGERDEARALIESCADCAALAADIRLIVGSMDRLPAAKRTRDFAITQEHADRLRGSRLTRWLRGLAAPGWASALRPVAGVALSIGLVMAVVGTSLPGVLPAAAPAGGDVRSGQSGATQDNPEPAASALPVRAPEVNGPPAADPGTAGENFAQATQDPITQEVDTVYLPNEGEDTDGQRDETADLAAAADPTRGMLLYGGLAIAALSFGLLALAWAARRYFADPLLR